MESRLLPPVSSPGATRVLSGHRGSPSLTPGGDPGYTLLELVTVLLLLGVAFSLSLPPSARLLDRMVVVGAREATVGLFHQVRMEAVARGGAVLEFQADPPLILLRAGGVVLLRDSVAGGEKGVGLILSGGRSRSTLTFDALGLGRVASQTLRFRRGGSEAVLVVSSLGRVTRR